MCTSFMHQCFDTVGWVSRRNWVMMCWCRYLSGASCRLFAYGPVDATVPPNAIISCTLVLPFWYRLTQVFLEKRPLNGCSSSSNVLACRFNPVFLFFLSAVIVVLYLVISWLFLVISYVWNVKISVMLEFALNLLNLCIAFHFSLLSCGHCPHLVMSVYRHGLRLSVCLYRRSMAAATVLLLFRSPGGGGRYRSSAPEHNSERAASVLWSDEDQRRFVLFSLYTYLFVGFCLCNATTRVAYNHF